MDGRKRRRRKKKSEWPITKAKVVIRNIVKVLRKDEFKRAVGVGKPEVFVGGSVGQGTAITGHYDLDLVLYSKGKPVIDYKKADEKGYDVYLERIRSYLQVQLSPHYIPQKANSDVAIKFRYMLPENGYLDVDLLLSPYWSSEADFLHTLGSGVIKNRQRFSVSASKYQTAFIKGQPQRVRELIKRAKAWRNVAWDGEKCGRPKSYLITLLVIIASHRRRIHLRSSESFKALAEEVGEEMKELVYDVATNDKLDLKIPGTSSEVATSPLLDAPPRIIDPVNPANNVYRSGITKVKEGDKWRSFQDKVHTFDITSTAEKIMQLSHT